MLNKLSFLPLFMASNKNPFYDVNIIYVDKGNESDNLEDVDFIFYGSIKGVEDFYVVKKDSSEVWPINQEQFKSLIDFLVNNDEAWQRMKKCSSKYKKLENLSDSLRNEPEELESILGKHIGLYTSNEQ
jgi:hypothetical protein